MKFSYRPNFKEYKLLIIIFCFLLLIFVNLKLIFKLLTLAKLRPEYTKKAYKHNNEKNKQNGTEKMVLEHETFKSELKAKNDIFDSVPDKNESIHEIYELEISLHQASERWIRIHDYCESNTTDQTNLRTVASRNFISLQISESGKHQTVLWCPVFKAASSNWFYRL